MHDRGAGPAVAAEAPDLRRLVHDANNQWTVVAGHLQLLEQRLADRPDLRASAVRGLRAAFRGALLGERALALLRPWTLVPEPLELGAFLRDWSGSAVLPLLGPDVALEQAPSGAPVAVEIDRDRLALALLELVLEALERMPAGRLTLAAERSRCGVGVRIDHAGSPATPDPPGVAELLAAAVGGRVERRRHRDGARIRLLLGPQGRRRPGGVRPWR
jgi:hypothetical protein